MARYFIIAGEASGDLHASNLMAALQLQDAAASFVGLGGDKMRAVGCELYVDYREMAYMGVMAVLKNLSKVRRNLQVARQALKKENPDVLILIDYPSFNLQIAKYCKKHLPHTKIVYYIPPKVWAWKKWRVHKIAQLTDMVLGIFPFETDFYARYGYKCEYVGNPTNDCIRGFVSSHSKVENMGSPSIAILPGSRKSEISHCLPVMLQAARKVANGQYRIVVAAAPGVDDAFYQAFLQGEQLTRDTYTLVASADAAIVNSGTATLETALIGCPQTAVYHIACSKYLEWLIRPILFTISHFTLVNIILGKEVIQELIASRFTEENLIEELSKLLLDTDYRQQMIAEYAVLQSILGDNYAAETAAHRIYTLVK